MEKSRVEIMEEILVKLEDIKNSQESLVEKVGVIQVDLFNNPDPELEDELGKLNKWESELYDFINKMIEDYEMRINNEKLNAA
jgi:hypothetical protein